MKLSKELKHICEVLNTNSLYFLVKQPTKNTEMDKYLMATNSNGHPRLIIPIKGSGELSKYRPITLMAKTHFGHESQIRKVFNQSGDVFGEEGKVDFLTKYKYQVTLYNSIISQNGGDSASDNVVKKVKELTAYKIKKDYGWMDSKEFYLWLIKESVNQPVIDHYFPELKTIKTDAETIKHKDVELIGFDEKKHKDIIDSIDKAEALFKKSGVKNMVYGKIFLVPKRGQRGNETMADYTFTSDTMRVFDLGAVKYKDTMLHTLIHELGHRYYYKFITREGQSEVLKSFYERVKAFKERLTSNVDDVADSFGIKPPKVGDVLEHEKFGQVKFVGTSYASLNSRKSFFRFDILDKDGKPTTKYLKFDSLAQATLFFHKNTTVSNAKKLDKWLPSTYALTSDKEWFAEVFANGIMENDKEVIKWIKDLK